MSEIDGLPYVIAGDRVEVYASNDDLNSEKGRPIRTFVRVSETEWDEEIKVPNVPGGRPADGPPGRSRANDKARGRLNAITVTPLTPPDPAQRPEPTRPINPNTGRPDPDQPLVVVDAPTDAPTDQPTTVSQSGPPLAV